MNKYVLLVGITVGALVLLNYWEIKKLNKLINSLVMCNNDIQHNIELLNRNSLTNNSNNIDTIQKEIDSYKKEINELDNQIEDESTLDINNIDQLSHNNDVNSISKEVEDNINNIEYDQNDTLSQENELNDNNINNEGDINNKGDFNDSLTADSTKILQFYYENYNVPDLKSLCKDNGLIVSGNKKNLIERLLESNILKPKIENASVNIENNATNAIAEELSN